MVEYADKDKDGVLSWDEFKEVVQREYPNNAWLLNKNKNIQS